MYGCLLSEYREYFSMATFEELKLSRFKFKSAEFIFKRVKLMAARHPRAVYGSSYFSMAIFENLKITKFKLKSTEFLFRLVKLMAARHPVATLGDNWMDHELSINGSSCWRPRGAGHHELPEDAGSIVRQAARSGETTPPVLRKGNLRTGMQRTVSEEDIYQKMEGTMPVVFLDECNTDDRTNFFYVFIRKPHSGRVVLCRLRAAVVPGAPSR